MKIFFNTKAFDCLKDKHKLDITDIPEEAELVVLGAKPINFAEFKKLRFVYRFGVGRENIPEHVLQQNNLKVFFPSDVTRRILYEATANFTVFLALRMFYSTSLGNIDLWQKYTREYLYNKRFLVIGKGNIGSRVLKKMSVFMSVDSFDIKENKMSELKDKLSISDIVSIHIPVSSDTICFIDREKLSWMKDSAILVNTARGALVDEEALYDRLVSSNMRAAFDVFWEEPYNGNLKQLGNDKFFMTPHTASQTIAYVQAGLKDILNIVHKGEL